MSPADKSRKRIAKRRFTVIGYYTDSENDPQFPHDPDGYQRFSILTMASSAEDAEANIRARHSCAIVAGVLPGRHQVQR
jgi:hypothetical protein